METETEQKQTAMQRLINYKFQLVKERGNELSAYDILELVIREAESLLPEERKDIEDAYIDAVRIESDDILTPIKEDVVKYTASQYFTAKFKQ